MRFSSRTVTSALLAALLLQTYLLYFFPSTDGPSTLPEHTDKVVHACMFGGPALLAMLRRWWWMLLLLAAYAPVSELIQDHIGRDADWRDAVSDLTGIVVLGALIGSWIRRRVA